MSESLSPAQYQSEALYWYRQQVSKATERITLLGLPTLWMELARTGDPMLRQLFITPAVGPQAQAAVAAEPKPEGLLHPLDALGQHRRVVLLGAPGSGKSTLAQWLVWYACQQSGEAPEWFRPLVPVLITLRDLRLQGLRSFADLLERHAATAGALTQAYREVRPAVDAAIRAGQALIVVDGYDEVPPDQLADLQTALQKALADEAARGRQNHWLIGSRPLGYEGAPLHGEIGEDEAAIAGSPDSEPRSHTKRARRGGLKTRRARGAVDEASPVLAPPVVLHLQPFDDRRIRSFADAWYALLTGSAEDGQVRSEKFRAALCTPSTRTLARTPNLLALMVMLFRQRLRLPDGRAELYAQITEAYLESIDAARFQRSRGEVGDAVPLRVKRQWLARLGFEMQRRRERHTGEEPAKSVVFSRQEVRGWLREAIASTHPEYAQDERFVDLYLRWLQARTGLLIERGEGLFSFVHLSFQEYFCALYLSAEFSSRDFGRCATPEEARERGLDPRVNPVSLWVWSERAEWQEVFVLAAEELAAQAGGSNVRAWLEAFLGRGFRWLWEGRFGYGSARAGLATRLLLNPHAGCQRFSDKLFTAILAWVDSCTNTRAFAPHSRAVAISDLLSSQQWSEQLWKHWNGRDHLNLNFVVISALPSLAAFSTLKTLDLSGTQVADIRPLADVSSLQTLRLRYSEVTELRPLSGLSSLHSLDLCGTQVSDLSALENLVSLRSLNLNFTDVSDLTPLAGLPSLQGLHLCGTKVSDVSPLMALSSLQELNLGSTHGIDLCLLSAVPELHSLHLSGDNTSDLRHLTTYESLRTLNLSDRQISDLSFLAELPSMQSLNLSGCRPPDLSVLTGMLSLQSLVLGDTELPSLDPIAVLSSLKSLDLSRSIFPSLYPISQLSSLKSLNLRGTWVADLGALSKLSSLESLHLQGTDVSYLKPLSELQSLQSLDLGGTKIADLGPLGSLSSLRTLRVSNTQISDIGHLRGFPSLQSLYLSETPVSDLRPLTECPNLKIVALPPIDELQLWPLLPLVERGVDLQ